MHCALGASEAPQLLVCTEKLPLVEIEPSEIAAVPLLVTVTDWDWVVPATASVPKLNAAGAIWMNGA